jgi:hypothetical protein
MAMDPPGKVEIEQRESSNLQENDLTTREK